MLEKEALETKPQVRRKSNLVDFLSQDGVELKNLGLRISHFTVFLIFLAFVGAIIASIAMKSTWPIIAVAGGLGFRSILAAVLKR